MNKPLFIAISGKKGSGKDEFARILSKFLDPLYVETTHFADPLKEMCIQLFGLDGNLVYGSNADKDQLTTVMWDGFPLAVRTKYNIDFTREKFVSNDSHFGQLIPIPRSGPMTHRELLQVMGTDIFRERVYSNIWAEYPFKQSWDTIQQGEIMIPAELVLIADCRFPNEVAETLKNNGLVIRINRKSENNDTHPSETALDGYNWDQARHFIVDNNGTIEDLERKAMHLASIIRGNYLS